MKELVYNRRTCISAHYYFPASTLCALHSCARVKILNRQSRAVPDACYMAQTVRVVHLNNL